MNVWKRSWFYRLWVVGGLASIAVISTVTGMSAEPGDDRVLKQAMAAVGVWVVGLLALQWRQLSSDQGRPDESASLMEALAVRPVAPGQLRAHANASWSFSRSGFAYLAGLCVAVVAGGVLHVSGVDGSFAPAGPGGPGVPYVFVPVLALVAIGVLRVPSQVRRAQELGDDWLEPLGLHTSALPSSVVAPTASGGLRHQVVGDTVLVGTRHGREVRVDLGAGGSVIHLAQATEPFERVSEDGRAHMTGGPDGIRVQRRGGAGGTAWLADLAAAEKLAAARRPYAATPAGSPAP